jgi:hypothetical protein
MELQFSVELRLLPEGDKQSQCPLWPRFPKRSSRNAWTPKCISNAGFAPPADRDKPSSRRSGTSHKFVHQLAALRCPFVRRHDTNDRQGRYSVLPPPTLNPVEKTFKAIPCNYAPSCSHYMPACKPLPRRSPATPCFSGRADDHAAGDCRL